MSNLEKYHDLYVAAKRVCEEHESSALRLKQNPIPPNAKPSEKLKNAVLRMVYSEDLIEGSEIILTSTSPESGYACTESFKSQAEAFERWGKVIKEKPWQDHQLVWEIAFHQASRSEDDTQPVIEPNINSPFGGKQLNISEKWDRKRDYETGKIQQNPYDNREQRDKERFFDACEKPWLEGGPVGGNWAKDAGSHKKFTPVTCSQRSHRNRQGRR